MRKKLKELENLRKRFKATFVKFGQKSGWKGNVERTVLFEDVINLSTGKKVTNHIWFNFTKGFEKLNLKEGDIITFDARVKEYTKGYGGYREELELEKPITVDYRLSHPTKIRRIK